VRREGTYRISAVRLLAVTLLCCGLALPLTAAADTGVPTAVSGSPSVGVEVLGASLTDPDAWAKPPLIAQLVAQGPGVVWYRFGAGPGSWERSFGYVLIPEGKQTLSTVLVAPDGTAGPVSEVVTRSDIHAYSPAEMTPASSQVSYVGEPQTTGSVTVRVVVGHHLGTIVRRVQGNTRFSTSAAVSSSATSRCKTVILASGDSFTNSLVAPGLAGAYGSPVLLVQRNSIPAVTKNEIRRLKATRVIICGSTSAVSAKTFKLLRRMKLKVERIGGGTRYDTAVAVAKRIRKLNHGANRVFIVRGDKFAAGVAVSPLAYSSRSPILLTSTKKLSAATAAWLKTAHYKSAVVVGTISGTALKGIRKRVRTVESWGGKGAYDTSLRVATHGVLGGGLSWQYVGIAQGKKFQDGLCGGVLAGKQHGVFLFTSPYSLDPGVANALAAHTADVRVCEIFGSRFAVADGVMSRVQEIFK